MSYTFVKPIILETRKYILAYEDVCGGASRDTLAISGKPCLAQRRLSREMGEDVMHCILNLEYI
jgi:hypothetical protein